MKITGPSARPGTSVMSSMPSLPGRTRSSSTSAGRSTSRTRERSRKFVRGHGVEAGCLAREALGARRGGRAGGGVRRAEYPSILLGLRYGLREPAGGTRVPREGDVVGVQDPRLAATNLNSGKRSLESGVSPTH